MQDTQDTNESLYQPVKKTSGNKKIVAKIKNLSGLKKLLIFGGGGLGVGFIVVIILIFFLANFELPDLMQIIQNYAFASVIRYENDATQNILDQSLALEAAPKETPTTETTPSTETPPAGEVAEPGSEYADIANEFESYSPSLWDSISNIRPSNIISNFKESSDIHFNYKQKFFSSNPELQSIEINGEPPYTFDGTTGLLTHLPIIGDAIRANDFANFWSKFAPALSDEIESQDLGTLSRAVVTRELFLSSGGTLSGWLLYKFKNSNSVKESQGEEAQGLADDARSGENIPPTSDSVSGENHDAEKLQTKIDEETLNLTDTEAALTSDSGLLNNGADAVLKQVGTTGFFAKILTQLDPIYTIGLPICIIYQSSIIKSGPTIDNNINEQTNVYDGLQSQADQEIAGSSQSNPYHGALANAVQGTNANLGDISNSDIESIASGGIINTSESVHPEAAPNGTYQHNILTALIPNSFIDKLLETILSSCKIITNVHIAEGIGIGSILVNALSGLSGLAEKEVVDGAAEVATEAEGDVVDHGIISQIQDFFSKITEVKKVDIGGGDTIQTTRLNIVKQALVGPIKNLVSIKSLATIAGSLLLGMLARSYVLMNTDAVNSGVTTGSALSNEALSGAMVQASEENRSNNFGRPLSESEMTQQDIQSSQALGNAPNQQSLYDKYASLSNPFSLISRIAVSIDGLKTTLSVNNLLNYVGEIFDPIKLFNNVINVFNYRPALAAAYANPIDSNFGIVQFGWSSKEEARINSSTSFYPLENQRILTESGKEEQIAQTYAACFGYSFNSSGDTFNPTSPNSKLTISQSDGIGNMLANGDIQRNSEGYVINRGLCSQKNLGYNNPKFGHNVFRFRLAMLYDTDANSLCNASYVSNTDNLSKCY